jgi:hypothetical protein
MIQLYRPCVIYLPVTRWQHAMYISFCFVSYHDPCSNYRAMITLSYILSLNPQCTQSHHDRAKAFTSATS